MIAKKREGYLGIFDAKHDLMFKICPYDDKKEWHACYEEYMPLLDEIERAVRENEKSRIRKLLGDLKEFLG